MKASTRSAESAHTVAPVGRAGRALPVQRSTFIGRKPELKETVRLLAEGRVVTLTGAAGSGKTRLALEAAGSRVEASPDGVWFVELAAVRTPEHVLAAVAAAMEVRERPGATLEEAIYEAVGEGDSLLVLDNCEHMIEVCADLAATLVSRCPRLALLVTSRIPLHIAGESVVAVRPLPIEDEAVDLFTDRVHGTGSAFNLDDESRPAVEAVCRRLDGLPLAIELSAAWVAIMSPAELLPLLDHRFEILMSGSPGTAHRAPALWAAVDWSHELLEDRQRALFRRLSVFAGGFSREAVEQVCGDDALPVAEILNALFGLCDGSMVVVEDSTSGKTRYRMLETLHDYALERLRDAGEEETFRDRHLVHFCDVGEQAYRERMSGGPRSVVEVLDADRDNVREALDWSRRGDSERGLCLAGTLVEDVRPALFGFREMRARLEEALGRSTSRTPCRARALVACGYMAIVGADDEQAQKLLADGCTGFEELGDRSGEAWARLAVALEAWILGDLTTARAQFRRSETLHAELGNRLGAERALLRRGIAEALTAETRSVARAALEDALREATALDDIFGQGIASSYLGFLEAVSEEPQRAKARIHDGLRMLAVNADPLLSFPLNTLALCVVDHDATRAVRLRAAADAVHQRAGMRIPAAIQAVWNQVDARAASSLSEDAVRVARAEGTAMSLDEALAYAFADSEQSAPGVHRARRTELTRREIEVTHLVTEGITNRQIAERLSVSVRTVESHVANILSKLGLRTRSQIVGWAIRTSASTKDP